MTHFVYPYIIPKNPVFGWELMFSLRSLESNYLGEFDITIIGDLPDWLNPTAIKFIPFKNFDNTSIELKASNINLRYAEAAKIYDAFTVVHDDMYLVNKCTPENLNKWRHLEKDFKYLGTPEEYNNLSLFQKLVKNTHDLLKKNSRQYNINYITHTPFEILSDEFSEIQKIYGEDMPYPYNYLVGNHFQKPSIYLGDFVSGHFSQDDYQLNKKAKILCHDEIGYLYQPWIINLLYQLFPKSSRFEKKDYV